MYLYEIRINQEGASYVRCYAWASEEYEACQMFLRKNPSASWEDIVEIRKLLSKGEGPFITDLNSEGWERGEQDANTKSQGR